MARGITVEELLRSDGGNVQVWNEIKPLYRQAVMDWVNNSDDPDDESKDEIAVDGLTTSVAAHDMLRQLVKIYDSAFEYFSEVNIGDMFGILSIGADVIEQIKKEIVDDELSPQDIVEYHVEKFLDTQVTNFTAKNLVSESIYFEFFNNEYFIIDNKKYCYINWDSNEISLLNLDASDEEVYIEYEDVYQVNDVVKISVADIISDYNYYDENKEKIVNFILQQLISTKPNLKNLPRSTTPTHQLQIADPTLYGIAYELKKLGFADDQFVPIREIKKLSGQNFKLAKLLTKKPGQLLLQKFNSGFSIDQIKSIQSPKTENFVNTLRVGKDLLYNFDTWTGGQRLNKSSTNYVFRLDFNRFLTDKILDDASTRQVLDPATYRDTSARRHIQDYMRASNHPTNKDGLLTFGWVRFTINEDMNNVLLDEIQTDIDDDKMLGKQMLGWEDVLMKAFIDFVRNKLGYQRIFMPTYQTKLDFYDANPPMRLYKELPNRFGFVVDKGDDRFMVLENRFRSYIKTLIK